MERNGVDVFPTLHDEIDGLLQPLTVGASIAAGWHVRRIRRDAVGRWTVTLAGPEADLVLAPHRDAPCLARSRRFDLYVKTARGKVESSELNQVIQRVVALVQHNDAQERETASPSSECVPPDAGAVLWLVPGHLGDPDDISVRTLRVLRHATRIAVEAGKMATARDMLRQLGVARPDDAWLELGIGAAQAQQQVAALLEVLQRGEDVALFGVDEGIPCFCDPGRTLLAAVTAQPGIAVRTLGGPSALGMALLRLPRPIEDFRFVAIGAQQLQRILDQVDAGLDSPLLTFVTGAELAQLAAQWQQKSRPALEMTACRRLTQPEELALPLHLSGAGLSGAEAILPSDPLVLAVWPQEH